MNELPGLTYTPITGNNDRLISKYRRLDEITRENSAFASFTDLVNAEGNYRPSLCMTESFDLVELADGYDEHMERIGDDRRAFRYGAGVKR